MRRPAVSIESAVEVSASRRGWRRFVSSLDQKPQTAQFNLRRLSRAINHPPAPLTAHPRTLHPFPDLAPTPHAGRAPRQPPPDAGAAAGTRLAGACLATTANRPRKRFGFVGAFWRGGWGEKKGFAFRRPCFRPLTLSPLDPTTTTTATNRPKASLLKPRIGAKAAPRGVAPPTTRRSATATGTALSAF